ncbi:hypothetical protein CHELA1G2_12977 [Hyphomicrobiales bacterium]|nr:hypothetical protein CHELA1G2_12977 [Hyphomicrobiales bacterium]
MPKWACRSSEKHKTPLRSHRIHPRTNALKTNDGLTNPQRDRTFFARFGTETCSQRAFPVQTAAGTARAMRSLHI